MLVKADISPRLKTQSSASKDWKSPRSFKQSNSTGPMKVWFAYSTAHYGRVETAISFLPSKGRKPNPQMSLEHENKKRFQETKKRTVETVLLSLFETVFFLLKRSTRPSALNF